MTRKKLLLSTAAAGAVFFAGSAAVTQFGAWRLGYDPALGSGPVGTVVQDVISLLIYFLIASALVF